MRFFCDDRLLALVAVVVYDIPCYEQRCSWRQALLTNARVEVCRPCE
jgi:hypothetical protein